MNSIEFDYRSEVQNYVRPNGMVTHQKGIDSGNAWIYTSMHLMNLKRMGWLRNDDLERVEELAMACMPKVYGLLQRAPDKPDFQSHDDLIVATLMFKTVGIGNINLKIWEYCKSERRGPWGLDLKYIYNTELPGEWHRKAYLGRFVQLRAHMAYVNNQMPETWERMGWSINVKQSCFASPSNQDAWFLTHCLCKAAVVIDPTQWNDIKRFERTYLKKLNGYTRGGIHGLYTRTLEPGHPVGQIYQYEKILD